MSVDLDYEEYLDKVAKDCHCCAGCCAVPCGGCTAGGICDELDCRCGDDWYAACGNWWRDGGGLEPADD